LLSFVNIEVGLTEDFLPAQTGFKVPTNSYLVGQSYMLLALLWDPPNHEATVGPIFFSFFFFLPQNFGIFFLNLVIGFKQEL